MFSHVLLSLFLLDAPAPMAAEMRRTFDLGKLSYADAQQLEGKPVRVSLIVATVPDFLALEQTVDAVGDGKVVRSVRFEAFLQPGPLKLGQRIMVEGVIRTRIIRGCVDGRRLPEKRQIEVRDARPVSPCGR